VRRQRPLQRHVDDDENEHQDDRATRYGARTPECRNRRQDPDQDAGEKEDAHRDLGRGRQIVDRVGKRCQVDQAVSGEPEFERLVVFRHAQPDKAAAEDERAEPGEPRRPRSGEQQIRDDAAVASAPGGAMSENGRLRHDEGTQGSGARRRRVLELLTLWSSAGTTSSAMNPIDVNTMMSF